jgi:hypothetical protein
LKPQYTRQFYTKLSEDEFIRIFEAFCFLSFSDEVYSFEGKSIQKYVDEAILYDGEVGVLATDYVSDIVENVCVVLREGEHCNFLHRSFQEYFAACFVIGRGRNDITDILEWFGTNLFDTSVVEFIAQMNREALDRTYTKKIVPSIVDDLSRVATDAEAFSYFYSEFSIKDDGSSTIHTFVSDEEIPKYALHLNIIEKVYGRTHGYAGPHVLLQSAVRSDPKFVPQAGQEFLFGPDRDAEQFNYILERSGFKEKISQYFEGVLGEVAETERRRDALTEKRALSRRVFQNTP